MRQQERLREVVERRVWWYVSVLRHAPHAHAMNSNRWEFEEIYEHLFPIHGLLSVSVSDTRQAARRSIGARFCSFFFEQKA